MRREVEDRLGRRGRVGHHRDDPAGGPHAGLLELDARGELVGPRLEAHRLQRPRAGIAVRRARDAGAEKLVAGLWGGHGQGRGPRVGVVAVGGDPDVTRAARAGRSAGRAAAGPRATGSLAARPACSRRRSAGAAAGPFAVSSTLAAGRGRRAAGPGRRAAGPGRAALSTGPRQPRAAAAGPGRVTAGPRGAPVPVEELPPVPVVGDPPVPVGAPPVPVGELPAEPELAPPVPRPPPVPLDPPVALLAPPCPSPPEPLPSLLGVAQPAPSASQIPTAVQSACRLIMRVLRELEGALEPGVGAVPDGVRRLEGARLEDADAVLRSAGAPVPFGAAGVPL